MPRQIIVDQKGNELFTMTNPGYVMVVGGSIPSGDTDGRPANPQAGDMYLDTEVGKPIWFDGDDWIDATGTVV